MFVFFIDGILSRYAFDFFTHKSASSRALLSRAFASISYFEFLIQNIQRSRLHSTRLQYFYAFFSFFCFSSV